MNRTAIILASLALASCGHTRHSAGTGADTAIYTVPTDSIILSDPAVLADSATGLYYMTGTGGQLWTSPDLRNWSGPADVACVDTTSWMGKHPAIWAAELHRHNGRYYYSATFTNDSIIIALGDDGNIPRRASHILVADNPAGPYRPAGNADYLPSYRPTLDGTFWVDSDGEPYMVFCGEWIYNQNGTMEKIRLNHDLTASVDTATVMFRASDSPWSRERRGDGVTFNRVTDGPWVFRTATGRLGMIWTSWVFSDYTTGVAYSESGTLDGPWIQHPEPILPPNYGHGMIFTDLEGRTILSAHSHANVDGRYIRRPTFWRVDLSGDSLRVIERL